MSTIHSKIGAGGRELSFQAAASIGLLSILLLTVSLARPAQATDPISPTEVVDDGQGFRFELALAVPPTSVTVGTVYNRIAGAPVDAGASSAQGVPVARQLTLQEDAQGRYFVDANPFGTGQPPLPNGVYSQWLETLYTPGPETRNRVPFRQRKNLYFRVINGTAQRLTLAGYSARVDPASQRKNKIGALEPVHLGATAPKLSSTPTNPMPLVESGEQFSTPDNSEQGQ